MFVKQRVARIVSAGLAACSMLFFSLDSEAKAYSLLLDLLFCALADEN